MDISVWKKCSEMLQHELTPQQYNTWIKPLQAEFQEGVLCLFAQNRFVLEWVNKFYLIKIEKMIKNCCGDNNVSVKVEVGVGRILNDTNSGITSVDQSSTTIKERPANYIQVNVPTRQVSRTAAKPSGLCKTNNLNTKFTFDTFVEGKSNQLARAAAAQVGENPGEAYNPLFLYGGVGLGKTHLMHAVGNLIVKLNPNSKVVYLHSERFVADMVKAIKNNMINEFKKEYRAFDALLIDDIQFFAGKERSQEEFFHTFNALLEGQRQIILTCDRYPKEIKGVEERLKSRFGWGLTVAVEPPDLETRVAILVSKANACGIKLEHDVAFFIAKRICSNVRELEGVLKRVVANAQFTGKPITIDFVQEALKDLLALQEKLVTIENIIKTTADYFKLRVADLKSKRRSRSVVRPRQIAMTLSKELTNHSLPEIGDAFGGRDHTTVMHACKLINNLKDTELEIKEAFSNLLRILST